LSWLIFVGERQNFKIKGNALSIATIGNVNGLGNITQIPESAFWTNEVAVIKNNGYIVKMSDGTYIRLFVSNWKEEYAVSYNGSTYTKYYCTIKWCSFNP